MDKPEIRLRRDRDADLVLVGPTLLGEVSSERPGVERWTELRVWSLPSGAFVAEQVGRSRIDGERDRCRAWHCANHAEVVYRLRRGWLALELYSKLGIDGAERVE
jgi:hypothetical protein